MLTISKEEVLAFNPELDENVINILIRDGLAMARRVAPCIDDDNFAFADAAVAVIRGAVLRWAESGSGGIRSESNTAGPFGQTTTFDTRQTRRSLFFPSEIKELEALCSQSRGTSFAVDTLPVPRSRCVAPAGTCPYFVGSMNSPCQVCGDVIRPDVGQW